MTGNKIGFQVKVHAIPPYRSNEQILWLNKECGNGTPSNKLMNAQGKRVIQLQVVANPSLHPW